MATLSQVTSLTRIIIKWGAIGILSLIILLTIVRIGTNIRNKFFPPLPPPPTVAFGKLTALVFPKSALLQKLSYSIETVTGNLPTFSSQIKVYKTVKNQPNLLSLQKARERVAALGFTTGEIAISSKLYQWSDPADPGRSIKFDIVENDFDMKSAFYDNAQVLSTENLPDPKKAMDIAKSFLTSLNLFPTDIDLEGSKASFFSIQGNFLTPVTSLSNAQIVRIDLFQKSIDKLPIIYLKKDNTLINMLIGSSRNKEQQVVEAHFFYRVANLDNPSTYPIKTTGEAFDDLKNNNAYIVSVDKTKTDIAIKNVYLGYYVNPDNDDLLYPVFVFEGNNDFLAYVLAISPSEIEQPSQ